MDNREATGRAMKTAWIIWAAHMGALVLYTVVITVLGAKGIVGPIRWVSLGKFLFLFGMLVGLVSLFARSWLLQYFVQRVRGGMAARGAHLSLLIFSIALGEIPAILAIVMTVAAGISKLAYLLIALSALALLMNRPRVEELEGLLKIESQRTPGGAEGEQ